jgi:hypothetical protein
MSTAFTDACIHPFPHVWCNPVKSFCSDRKRFTRCQVVFYNEHSLHLWKRHPCTSNAERQLTDWRKQVTTWHDLRGLLYSRSDIVRLIIQSNCTESKPSINILIWVAWLCDHSVCLSVQTGIIFLNSINKLIFVMVECGVFRGTNWILKYYFDELRLQRVKHISISLLSSWKKIKWLHNMILLVLYGSEMSSISLLCMGVWKQKRTFILKRDEIIVCRNGENCTTKIFVVSPCHAVLVEWLNQEGWNGINICYLCWRQEMSIHFGCHTSRRDDTWKLRHKRGGNI